MLAGAGASNFAPMTWKKPRKEPTPLYVARARVGLTQAALAAKAGLTLGTVSIVERSGYVTEGTAAKLAAALGIDPSELRETP